MPEQTLEAIADLDTEDVLRQIGKLSPEHTEIVRYSIRRGAELLIEWPTATPERQKDITIEGKGLRMSFSSLAEVKAFALPSLVSAVANKFLAQFLDRVLGPAPTA